MPNNQQDGWVDVPTKPKAGAAGGSDDGWVDVPQDQAPAQKSTIGPRGESSLMDDISSWWNRKKDYQGTLAEPGRSPSDIATGVGKAAAGGAAGAAVVGSPAIRTIAGMAGGTRLAEAMGVPGWVGAIGGGTLFGSGKLPKFGRYGGGGGGSRVAEEMAAEEEAGAGAGAEAEEVTKLPIGSSRGRGPLTPEQVPGKPQLKSLARGGDPRAGSELQRRGEKVLYTPEEGYAPPKSKQSLSDIMSKETPTATPKAAPKTKPAYKPSEKAGTMSEKRKSLGPEFESQSKEHQIDRYKGILRNPKATATDIKEAKSRLKELGATGHD